MKQNSKSPAGHSSNTLVSRSQFKPILFSTDMVKAILSGRKTQTRRIIKQAAGWDINWKVMPIKEEHLDGIQRYEIRCGTQYHLPWFKAKCNVGDILWVRETWAMGNLGNGMQPFYRADNERPHGYTTKWKPSLFMPKDACRLFLEVTDIKAERLQAISFEDAAAEGIKQGDNGYYKNYLSADWSEFGETAVDSFMSLWNKINKNWNDNPSVWVITFKVVECPQGFC